LTDPDYKEQWLQENDVVELEVDGLGILSNTIVREESDLSLLEGKKGMTVDLATLTPVERQGYLQASV
jgi:fumarylacetoacetate (FAA) hydrolase